MSGRGATSAWMGDIDQYMDERVVAEAFSMMGEHVVGVKLLKDHKTGQNRNYCFVELTSKEAVANAIRRLAGLPLPNYPSKRFKLNYSLRNQDQLGETSTESIQFGNEFSIYVGGLNTSTTDEELSTLFAHYKSFKEAKIVRDETQRSKGFGFVRFYTEADREMAIMQMNGAVGPMGVLLKVNKAQPKREIQATGSQPYHMGAGPGVTATGMMSGYHHQSYHHGGYGQMPYIPHQQQQMPMQMPMPAQPVHPVQPVQPVQAVQPAPQPAPVVPAKQKQEEDDEALEEHSAPVNMVATNLAFIQANQDFYKQLADSRWNPITSYSTTISEICQ